MRLASTLSVIFPFFLSTLHICFCFIAYIFSRTTFFSLPNDLSKFEKVDADSVEIRPRPNSYVPSSLQTGDYDEPFEMYIETDDEGIISHLSQIGPRPRSAR